MNLYRCYIVLLVIIFLVLFVQADFYRPPLTIFTAETAGWTSGFFGLWLIFSFEAKINRLYLIVAILGFLLLLSLPLMGIGGNERDAFYTPDQMWCLVILLGLGAILRLGKSQSTF